MNASSDVRDLVLASGRSLKVHSIAGLPGVERLPFTHKVLLENLVRHRDGRVVTDDDVDAVLRGDEAGTRAIAFHPARVFLHDTNGVPVLTDLAAMRDAAVARGADPMVIDTVVPAQLTVDHSVATDFHGRSDAPRLNVAREYERNGERYRFLKWGQNAFAGLQVVPPGAGIMHQINVERLASVVAVRDGWAVPDTVAGTDSHTTMVNGLGVLAWGVGGIEAEAAMLGQPISMLVPPVVGVELAGSLRPGVTATDLVLSLTERMRAEGVVGCVVEFFGAGVAGTSIATRCTIANMSPEFGSTSAMFPIDAETLAYLRLTGRSEEQVDLVERYAKAQLLWHEVESVPAFDRTVSFDLGAVEPSLAGPRRPQDRLGIADVPAATASAVERELAGRRERSPRSREAHDGAVAIASITSCTNTSNPQVMVAAGLLARNAVQRGLQVPAWVKTSLAPGSKVVTDYLARAGLDVSLDALGFHLVGYGCMTCIGNSGGLAQELDETDPGRELVLSSVLSGNRNFDGRINNEVSMNFLASPPLVVAYALAGTTDVDLGHEPVGWDRQGRPVMLDEIWPDDEEVAAIVAGSADPGLYEAAYATLFDGDEHWAALDAPDGDVFAWDERSTYLRRPPFLDQADGRPQALTDIEGARALEVLGDSVTTDHILPAGRIPTRSAAGVHLSECGVAAADFNTYASRRGNWEVMERAGFANVRLHNALVPDGPGGLTVHLGDRTREVVPVHEAARRYRAEGVPLVVLGGREYGTGSSRDWAAKVTALLGVRAVIAESFERIHRSNLVNMGVLPLELRDGATRRSLGLDGTEVFAVRGLAGRDRVPRTAVVEAVHPESGRRVEFEVVVRLDTALEELYYRAGGILPYVLDQRLRQA
ncbi:aconitate hydratase AcnA [Aeromicrobium massiliense]|uniref:aconitate hydratase AcnA n=1 Tax=Aeromicrobium massiliense TaxID=1464554 RepID=UPI000676A018|nr:aconitate hydratase AcnA [Aeromicrobium massiliense]